MEPPTTNLSEPDRSLNIADQIIRIEKNVVRMRTRYEQLAAAIAESEADLQALRRVEQRNLLCPPEAATDEGEESGHGVIKRVVVGALESVPTVFTRADIVRVLNNAYPENDFDESSISSVLKRLSGVGGEIEEIERGQGRRMTRYKRKASA